MKTDWRKALKICKTCQFWSTEKKGFCHYDNLGVGQFWSCGFWSPVATKPGAEKIKSETPAKAVIGTQIVNGFKKEKDSSWNDLKISLPTKS